MLLCLRHNCMFARLRRLRLRMASCHLCPVSPVPVPRTAVHRRTRLSWRPWMKTLMMTMTLLRLHLLSKLWTTMMTVLLRVSMQSMMMPPRCFLPLPMMLLQPQARLPPPNRLNPLHVHAVLLPVPPLRVPPSPPVSPRSFSTTSVSGIRWMSLSRLSMLMPMVFQCGHLARLLSVVIVSILLPLRRLLRRLRVSPSLPPTMPPLRHLPCSHRLRPMLLRLLLLT